MEHQISPRSQQQEFYDFFGQVDRISWDLYDLSSRALLEKKVGFALFGPPSALPQGENNNGDGESSTEEPPVYSEHHTGYDKKQVKEIEQLCEKIVAENQFSLYTKELYMSTLFTLCVTEKIGKEKSVVPTTFPVQDRTDVNICMYPVFRIRKCVGKNRGVGEDGHGKCFIFIDHEGRVYNSWCNYLSKNRIPKGILVTPKNGIYNADVVNDQEKVKLEECYSPACSLGKKFVNMADKAGIVTGVGATCVGIAVAIPAITVAAPVAAAGAIAGGVAGLYSIIRSSINLKDRGDHKQSIGLEDKEARNDWLGIAGGSAGVAAGGATKLFGTLVGRGVEIGVHGKNVVNVINGTALIMNGVGTVYGIYQIFDLVYNEKQKPSALMVFQVTTSIFFFTHSVINLKTADTIMKEKQASIIEEYKTNLRSNRHRKMFTKMEKETIRLAGDEVAGRRDVIRAIRNIQDKNDFFAGAVRINKGLNANNVKISFSPDGTARLNNVETIDPMAFWADGKNAQRATFDILPPPPQGGKVTAVRINQTSDSVKTAFNVAILNKTLIFDVLRLLINIQNNEQNSVIQNMSYYLSVFSAEAVQCFMNFFLRFISHAEELLRSQIEAIIPDISDHVNYLFNFLYSYLSRKTYDLLSEQNSSQDNSFLNTMEKLIMSLVHEGRFNEALLNVVVGDLFDYLGGLMKQREDQERVRGRFKCNVCDGYYYGKK